MSLILRRQAGKEGVSIDNGRCIVRVVKIDPNGSVHLSFSAAPDCHILREELIDCQPRDYGADEYVGEIKRLPDCPVCNNTGRDPMSDSVNWLPCKSCGRSGL